MKYLVRIVALATAAVALLALPASAQEDVRIHLIHGIPDTPVDVIVDGDVVFADFQPGDTEDLSSLAGETLVGLMVNLAGTDTTAIPAGDTALPATGNYTIIAHLDADGNPTLAVFENDTSPIEAGQGRLTVRHTAAAPAVDVLANGDAAFEGLTNPNEVSADLPTGTISASVVPAGETAPVVIGPADLAIEDGTSLIVYAVGSLEGETLTVLTESITGLGAAPAEEAAAETPVPSAVNTGNSPVSETSTGFPVALAAFAALLVAAVPVRRMAMARTR
ncbi:DUF4397 domain-containing protein [Actinospongicola halichondriae]|uniref:DUF4397 domain-containing protein n=1 Tax=Actinospongicola halichondriae TaxID=3236844 RepID=UPI003D376AC3